MKEKGKRDLEFGTVWIAVFALWTALIQCVDVRPVGQNGTNIGFAAFNTWFHQLTGAHMAIYVVTDWLGLVPAFICIGFGVMGFIQLVKRRSLKKVDMDLILLGFHYALVIFAYLIFEMIPINYRPIPIEGIMEASYPSSTTLLVLSVMPTLKFQVDRREPRPRVRKWTGVLVILFSALMVAGRLLSGVHWFTDIVGAVFLSAGLFMIYRGAVVLTDKG